MSNDHNVSVNRISAYIVKKVSVPSVEVYSNLLHDWDSFTSTFEYILFYFKIISKPARAHSRLYTAVNNVGFTSETFCDKKKNVLIRYPDQRLH